ncbi:MAG: PAS domain S-box protein [Bradymonadaceae bacterium]|nr:PAS domain S-box protein [Lujinxingiaceae bacterium]
MSTSFSSEAWVRLLNASLEAAAHGVVITDCDGAIIWINAAFTEMTGYESTDVIGRNPRILNSGAQDAAFYQSMWSTLLAGETWRGEVINRRKDGSLYSERQSIRPVYLDDGKITHFIAIKEDVTAQKTVAAKVKEMDRLIVIGTLADSIAHEVNNPLAYIRSSLDLLKRQLTDHEGRVAVAHLSPTEVREAIDEALEGTQRIEMVISGLQTLAANSDDPKIGPIDVEATIELAIKLSINRIRRCARLVRDYAPDPVAVSGNEAQLLQALSNILLNATEAIEVSGGDDNQIRVATRYGEGKVFVEISDTGIGMPFEVLPHIFEPFYSTRPKSDGVGLGLPICQNIVRKLGGSVEVESEYGAGAMVRIVLAMHV